MKTLKRVLILDCETTGISNNPATGRPDIIELAYIDVTDVTPKELHLVDYNALPKFRQLYNPMMEIHPEAFKVHGYTKEMLVGHPSTLEAKIEKAEYIVGHNCSFDYRCLGKPEGMDLICTLGLFRSLKKYRADIVTENNTLDSVVKYFYPEQAESLIKERHTAVDDCLKVYFFLIKLVELFPNVQTWEDLFLLQENLKKLKK